jgi:tetratricopeptide (TPR) repeat protein
LTIDPDGVALAAAKTLDDRTTAQQSRIEALEKENTELRPHLDRLEKTAFGRVPRVAESSGLIRFRFFLASAAAIVLVTAAYANSLRNSFHFDDAHVIENNLYLRSLDYVPRYFTDAHTFSSLPQNATYRPLVTLSLALDYARTHSLDPRPFHVTQIALLLIAGALLVVFFERSLGAWPALFAATLFCVHTANSETMNLISARSELISAIGLVASFILYQRLPFARRTLLYLLPLVIGALAKAPVVVFAPLLFAYGTLIENETRRRALRRALPPLVLGVALLVFLNRMNAREWTSGGGSAWQYAMTQPFVWLHYFRLFFLPVGLTADTDWLPFTHWYDTRAIVGDLFVLAFAWLAMRASRVRETRPIAFGMAWFAIALAPTSSIFPLAEVANEHRVFFAYIGLAAAVVWFLALQLNRKPRTLVGVGAIAVLLAFAIGTHERNETWRTEETLWADVIAKSPANGRAWMNHGLARMARGDYGGAREDFDRAAVFAPNYSVLEINRGIVEGQLGDQAAAERHFQRALALNPDTNAHFYYARWLVGRGRAPEALPHVQTATRQSPAFADAQNLAMRLAIASGAQRGRAWSDYASAFREGLQAIGRSDWLAAAEANRDALRHDPKSPDAWNNAGWSLAQLGFRAEAEQAYRASLALRPDDARTQNNLRLVR